MVYNNRAPMSTRLDTRTRPFAVPCLAVVGASGSGKTTLLERVIPALQARGLRASLIKHAHCGVQFDKPGKDSHRLKQAGAAQVLVATAGGYALVGDNPAPDTEPRLGFLLTRLDPSVCDLVLAEGFAHESGVPKLEVLRPQATEKAPKCWPADPDVIAVATDEVLAAGSPVTRLDLNDIEAVADFLRAFARREAARRMPECA